MSEKLGSCSSLVTTRPMCSSSLCRDPPSEDQHSLGGVAASLGPSEGTGDDPGSCQWPELAEREAELR